MKKQLIFLEIIFLFFVAAVMAAAPSITLAAKAVSDASCDGVPGCPKGGTIDVDNNGYDNCIAGSVNWADGWSLTLSSARNVNVIEEDLRDDHAGSPSFHSCIAPPDPVCSATNFSGTTTSSPYYISVDGAPITASSWYYALYLWSDNPFCQSGQVGYYCDDYQYQSLGGVFLEPGTHTIQVGYNGSNPCPNPAFEHLRLVLMASPLAPTATLTINVPNEPKGANILLAVNNGFAVSYLSGTSTIITLPEHATTFASAATVKGYVANLSDDCFIMGAGAVAGRNYICTVTYTSTSPPTLTINVPAIPKGAGLSVSINGELAIPYSAGTFLKILPEHATTVAKSALVDGYVGELSPECNIGGAGAVAGRNYVCTLTYKKLPTLTIVTKKMEKHQGDDLKNVNILVWFNNEAPNAVTSNPDKFTLNIGDTFTVTTEKVPPKYATIFEGCTLTDPGAQFGVEYSCTVTFSATTLTINMPRAPDGARASLLVNGDSSDPRSDEYDAGSSVIPLSGGSGIFTGDIFVVMAKTVPGYSVSFEGNSLTDPGAEFGKHYVCTLTYKRIASTLTMIILGNAKGGAAVLSVNSKPPVEYSGDNTLKTLSVGDSFEVTAKDVPDFTSKFSGTCNLNKVIAGTDYVCYVSYAAVGSAPVSPPEKNPTPTSGEPASMPASDPTAVPILKIIVPALPTGAAALLRVNSGAPAGYLTNTPVKSMKAGDKFTVTPIPVPGYTFSTNHCSLDTGAQLGTNYFCYVHYVRTAY